MVLRNYEDAKKEEFVTVPPKTLQLTSTNLALASPIANKFLPPCNIHKAQLILEIDSITNFATIKLLQQISNLTHKTLKEY